MRAAGNRGRKKLLIRVLVILAVTAALLMAFVISVNAAVKSAVKERVLTPQEAAELGHVDCILILGAGVDSDGQPSLMLRDRLERGIKLFNSGVSDRLLMSGDHGSADYDEVNVMKSYAIDSGIPSECVFMDHAGFSTYESMYRARDIFCAKRIVVVTQEYHIYRALYTAQRLGLEAYGVPAENVEYHGQTYRDFREMLARVKDFFYVLFSPEPTYLGDVIPVSGNGDLTND